LEKTDFAFIFEAFPVVILRLFRLLRVFRLAKAFPRLRSIVEALISGLTSVGWICLLILVYQYIAGCLCMLVFRENVRAFCLSDTYSTMPFDLKKKNGFVSRICQDPFHFGSLSRSMFTIMRMQVGWFTKSPQQACFN